MEYIVWGAVIEAIILVFALAMARVAARRVPRPGHNVCECGAWIPPQRCYCDECTQSALIEIEAQWERFGPKRSA